MRIAFDSRAASDTCGVGRYVRCLLDALTASSHGHEIVEATQPRQVDVFHSPWIDGVRVRTGCPQVVTLHDLMPLKRHSEYLRTGLRFRLRYMAVQRAARVIVPTEVVAADAVQHLKIDPNRIVVIAEAAASSMSPASPEAVAEVRRRFSLPDPYLVWVGGLEHPDPRKRIAALVETPREMPLVLVGPTREWAHELLGVTLTGRVSDADLAAIYTGAHALVMPSEDEGFGMPAVEALACGTPVVACDLPALREVLGGRATLVAQDDLCGLIEAGIEARRPAPSPPPWTWDDAARATWQVYASASGKPV